MIDILSYIIIFLIAFMIGRNSRKHPEQTNQEKTIEELKEKIAYYKDLCHWHVEDKERIKKNDNL